MVIKHHLSTSEEVHSLPLEAFQEALESTIARSSGIRKLTSEEIIEALYGIYKSWAMPSHPMHQRYRHAGLAYLLSFIHPDSLRKLLARGLRDERAMDEWTDVGGFRGIAVPKGVVGHWVAGNVPLLSLISVLQALLTRNVSIVKLSTKQEDWITPFLRSLAEQGAAGRLMAESVFVVSYPGEWTEANAVIAALADVRIAWGGQQAVQSVAGLPGKPDSGTMIFGPKFSCSAIDPSLMTAKDWLKLARDAVMFQQLACTSPHAVILKGTESEMNASAEKLAGALQTIASQGYYEALEAGEAVKVLEYRAAHWMQGERLIVSSGTEWTLHLHERLEPLGGQGMRIVHLYPCSDWQEAVRCFPSSIQTVSHRLGESDLKQIVESALHSGVSRFVPIGEAHTYDIPWDGMLVLDHLVRWIRVDL